ncbi:protein Gemin2 [Eurosta solidaginis]|uniref:protein Gemin2 n=1 Tax=Eurosta solidaginis TaxID=178769 RepID=UPI003530FC88
MATKSGEVLYQVEQKPNRKANVLYKSSKPLDGNDEMDISSGSSKMDTFQQQALEIQEPGPDFDPTAPPKDGEEYLTHMLYERKQCPAVMVKDPSKVVKNQTAAALTENFKDQEQPLKSIPVPGERPTKEWKEFQLIDFEQTREKVVMLRLELHRQKYDQTLEPPLTNEPATWRKFCQENPPLLKLVLRFSQRTLEQLLEYICDWLREGEENDVLRKLATTDDATPSTSNAACDMTSANDEKVLDLTDTDAWIGTWLYATLSCLHIPIEPEVHSTLRDIARVCIRLRGRLPKTMAGKAVPYNLFICLVAGAFGQSDFGEFV